MAPGLTALAAAIQADGFCTFAVSAPAGERSAQSHCISVGKHLHAWELPVEGAEEAWAVDGTPGGWRRVGWLLWASLTLLYTADMPCWPSTHCPCTAADSTMLALYGPLLRNRTFNLVVSGINRCGEMMLAAACDMDGSS